MRTVIRRTVLWGVCSAAVAVGNLAVTGTVAAQSSSPARLEHTEEHLHTPIEISSSLGWPELIELTLENFPRFIELSAMAEEASALTERGDSWFAERPQFVMRYQSDRPWDDVNLRERELGVELPLWRLGERRAATSLGTAANEGSTAATLALKHEVIGLLRIALWDIELAANELAVARDAARIAKDLRAAVDKRYEAGEAPLSDTLLVASTAIEREAAVIEAEALLVDAERVWQSLTGLNTRPAEFAEQLTSLQDFDDSHPRLQLADAEVRRARADIELTRRSSKGNPTLTIGPLDQRDSSASDSARSINVSLSMPFGGRSHSAVATAESSLSATRAEADRLQLLRDLDLDLHEARHSLLVIEESLELAIQRKELAARSFEMSQKAFTEGETSVLELLLSEEVALTTEREVVGLEVERQRAIALINQATGVWP